MLYNIGNLSGAKIRKEIKQERCASRRTVCCQRFSGSFALPDKIQKHFSNLLNEVLGEVDKK